MAAIATDLLNKAFHDCLARTTATKRHSATSSSGPPPTAASV